MDLVWTHPYRSSSSSCCCRVSPDSAYLANAAERRLVIRSLSSRELAVLHVFETNDAIDDLAWSRDARYILTVNYTSATVQVWSLANTHWRCEIKDPGFGIRRVWWNADASSVLCSSNDLVILSL